MGGHKQEALFIVQAGDSAVTTATTTVYTLFLPPFFYYALLNFDIVGEWTTYRIAGNFREHKFSQAPTNTLGKNFCDF